MGKGNLRKQVLELRSEGLSPKEISQTLDVPLGTVYRWIKEDSQSYVKVQEEVYTNSADWYEQAIEYCNEVASQNKKLRILLDELLTNHLTSEILSSRMIAALSSAIERHTNIEWRARGIDFLDLNRAISRANAAGYEVNVPDTITTKK